jgi:hypothetical protein
LCDYAPESSVPRVEAWLVVLSVLVIVASRPIEVRLWRAGRLSDRTLALLLVTRLPLIVGLVSVAQGLNPLLTALLVGATLATGLLFYRFALDVVRDRSGDIAEH